MMPTFMASRFMAMIITWRDFGTIPVSSAAAAGR